MRSLSRGRAEGTIGIAPPSTSIAYMRFLISSLLAGLAGLCATENAFLSAQADSRSGSPPTSSQKLDAGSRLEKDDVLSIRGGRFYLDGKPFVEISFNKYDLFWQLYDQLASGKSLDETNPAVLAQDKALKALQQLGFKTIRIFALPWGPAGPDSYADAAKRKNLFSALDKTLELCDRHNMRIVWSLSAASFTDTKLDPEKGWIYGAEQERELIANPESRGRRLLYRYIDETVARYRGRKAVLMWEISNEVTLQADIGDSNRMYNGERMPTLKEVSVFFDDVAKRIKSIDPLRLVSSGGSNMRECQWHLYQGQGWKKDTFEQQYQCFQLLYASSAVDVMDIHSYPDNEPGYKIAGTNGGDEWLEVRGYQKMAQRLGKPLMIGELGLHAVARTNQTVWGKTPDYFETYAEAKAAKPWIVKTLNEVIESGVGLTYWWCYQSDDPAEKSNPQRFDIDNERNPELMQAFVEANKRLKSSLR
jgi:hypothetical protein